MQNTVLSIILRPNLGSPVMLTVPAEHLPLGHALSEDRILNSDTCPIALSVMIERRTTGFQHTALGEERGVGIPQSL